MDTLQILERYKKMDKMIKRRNTGTPHEFATKLGISKSQLFNHLDYFRKKGAEITYNKTLETYIYIKPVELTAEFSIRPINGK